MTDRKISELTNITGANLADADEFPVVDTSADETKAITFGELKTAFDTSTGFVRITGDTMTGDLTVPNVITSGNVDGRDVSADGTKLDTIETNAEVNTVDSVNTQTGAVVLDADDISDTTTTNKFTTAGDISKLAGIEASADVTDTTNVTAAGALMDSELADIAAVKALDQGVATTDDPTFANTQLAEIAATISDTAVDVFVYDTSKDSDGGAWRKRTQGTSWYNETLNTATRGSRKEFPSVAVIVAESNQVTIYDGDDPDLPMWMVFQGNSIARLMHINGGSYTPTSISMLNGHFVVGNTLRGVVDISFIADTALIFRSSTSATVSGYRYGGIVSRNVADIDLWDGTDPLGVIINDTVNDVAMTVLPNAPIDAATGLPVPTIAVGTAGGISVIRDDGTVVDLTYTFSSDNAAFDIDLDNSGRLSWASRDIASNGVYLFVESSIPASDKSTAPDIIYTPQNISGGALRYSGNNSPYCTGFLPNAIGTSTGGITHLAENITAPSEGMVAYTTSTYNTGWMNGDIKLATLSDTDDTDVTGSELVTNGTFDSNINDWQARGNASNSWNSSGYIDLDRNGETANAGRYVAYQVITGLTVGATYTASAEVISVNPRFNLNIGNSALTADFAEGAELDAAGIATVTFTATSTSVALGLGCRSSQNATATVDNVTLRLAEEDRSVNGNGLQVFGTVTKNPVSSGADLVAYSNFSPSNYLKQPYNSDLDFGTGDFCVMGWVSLNAAVNDSIVARKSTTPNRFKIDTDLGKIRCLAGSNLTSSIVLPANTFNHFAVIRVSGVVSIYVNGIFDVSGADTGDVDSGLPLYVGINDSLGQELAGSLSLLRISATAPSPEQIAKIYRDEAPLFQENAQATLYGSSDAVTALAYDDSTELLHVGTSAGRSDFQGLRRVNNTTNAVGAAISASNGMIVEE